MGAKEFTQKMLKKFGRKSVEIVMTSLYFTDGLVGRSMSQGHIWW